MRQGLVLFAICWFLVACGDKAPLKQQRLAKQGVVVAKISDNRQFTVYSSTNHNIGVWDNQRGNLKYEWRHVKGASPNIVAISISGNNRYVLTAEKRNMVLWDMGTGQALRFFATDSDIQAIALSHKGGRALLGLQDATAIYLDLTTGQKLKSLQHLETVNAVALSADGRFALTGADDKLAVLWDLNSNQALRQWKHAKRVQFVTFSPQSHYALTSASQSAVSVWRLDDGQLVSRLKGKSLTVVDALFSNDESRFLLSTLPNRIAVHRTKGGELLTQWRVPKQDKWKPSSTFVYGLAFDGSRVISADSQGVLSWWALE